MSGLTYSVKCLKESGLAAKWESNHKGEPIIYVRDPKADEPHRRNEWWPVDREFWHLAQRKGIRHAFDFFSALVMARNPQPRPPKA